MRSKADQAADLAGAIRNGDVAARLEALSRAARTGPEAIPTLAELLESPDPAAARAADEALRRIVLYAGRRGGEPRPAAQKLAKLAGRDRPRKVRAAALYLLGFVAGPEEITIMANQLTDPDIREEARMALERVPGRAAEQALRDAKVPADYRAALDQSLRHRKIGMREIGLKR